MSDLASRLAGRRVGYVPYGPDLAAPGDRRRFARWARLRGVSFEQARPDQRYDLVVLTQAADPTVWSRRVRGGERVVYDLTDAYLDIPRWNLKGALRGTAKFLAGQTRHFQPSYWAAIAQMCRRADAVVCCSVEQRQSILPFNHNVHCVLDMHEVVLGPPKGAYAASNPVRLVWEGLPENVATFRIIASVLERVGARHPIELEVLTRPYHYRYLGRFLRQDTARLLQRVVPVPTRLVPWEESGVASRCTAADVAVIPIPLSDALYAGKPENKLIQFWRMGLPVVASATPAYARAMRACDLDMACRTEAEWDAVLESCVTDENYRRTAAERGRAYAEREHSEAAKLGRWDAAIASALA